MTIRGPFAYVLVILLIVSLAANFMMLGFAAARIHNTFDDGGPVDKIVELGARAFPRELRREIGDEMKSHRTELRQALRELGNARGNMFRQMAAEPLDRAALNAAFVEVRAKTDELQRIGQQVVEGVLQKTPPEERAKIRPPKHGWR